MQLYRTRVIDEGVLHAKGLVHQKEYLVLAPSMLAAIMKTPRDDGVPIDWVHAVLLTGTVFTWPKHMEAIDGD